MTGHLKAVIIGAGVAGVFTTKELYLHGERNYRCFEALPRAGGVYARYSYPDMYFTTSTQTTAFSDYPWKGKLGIHFSIPQFLGYLDEMIEHFGFGKQITYNCKVEHINRLADGKWQVWVHYGIYHNHFSYTPEMFEGVTDRWETYTCDHLVVSSGTHNYFKLPDYDGLKEYKGVVHHSSTFQEMKESYRGKTVLILGTGESGCDLVRLCGDVAKKVFVCVPKHTGVYFPRTFEEVPADTVDCRLLYSVPRMFDPLVEQGFRDRFEQHSTEHDAFHMAAEANHENYRTALNSYGVKTFDMFYSVTEHGSEIVGGVERFDGYDVVFTDGSRLAPDVVLFCTGYNLRFGFFEKFLEPLACELTNIRALWKHMIHPDYDDKLILAGFARPNMTSLLIAADLQSRCAGALIAGKLKLPPRELRIRLAAEDRAYFVATFGEKTTSRLRALVDHLYYNDSLAEFMGASPPYAEALARGDLKLWQHLMLASLNGCHYRFYGPNALPWDEAATIVKNIPLHKHYMRACIRTHCISSTVHLIGAVLSPFHKKFRAVGHFGHFQEYLWLGMIGIAGVAAANAGVI